MLYKASPVLINPRWGEVRSIQLAHRMLMVVNRTQITNCFICVLICYAIRTYHSPACGYCSPTYLLLILQSLDHSTKQTCSVGSYTNILLCHYTPIVVVNWNDSCRMDHPTATAGEIKNQSLLKSFQGEEPPVRCGFYIILC